MNFLVDPQTNQGINYFFFRLILIETIIIIF